MSCKKCELTSGWYYIKSNYYENGSLIWCENGYFIAGNDVIPDERISEVLASVPSYEEYLALKSDQMAKEEGAEIVEELQAENEKLKELIEKDKNTICDLKLILERMNYGGAEYDALKQIIHDFEKDIQRYETEICND